MENWTLAVVCPILVLLPVHNANKQNCSSHMPGQKMDVKVMTASLQGIEKRNETWSPHR